MSSEVRILDAALTCLREDGGLTMVQVAEKAGLSRQAIYLHFPGREALLAALQARQPATPDIESAPSARAALGLLVAAQASTDPGLAALDEPEDAATSRLARCHAVALRFQAEGALAPQLSPAAAADLLWSLTGPRLWDALVTGRGWSAERTRAHVTFLATGAVTK
jgi:AcrR family transcriptional regulator